MGGSGDGELTREDFEASLSRVRPSVDPTMLALYLEFRARAERT
jgi:hypothetical protein